ncbi:hypothetical protein [uncultured Bartonella sp.]|uniref:hypothetical protein n=1 Tax=uncultured Bartonella sp. TaxID=104108 RepID=UPI0025EDDAB0|nr:hypothetical protein [uncultured Bartonella sp.]
MAAVDCVVVACAGMEGAAFNFPAFSEVFRDVLPVSACGFFTLAFFTGFRDKGAAFLSRTFISRTFPLFAAGSLKSINIQSVSSLEGMSIE